MLFRSFLINHSNQKITKSKSINNLRKLVDFASEPNEVEFRFIEFYLLFLINHSNQKITESKSIENLRKLDDLASKPDKGEFRFIECFIYCS